MPATGTGRMPHAECGRGGDTAQAGPTVPPPAAATYRAAFAVPPLLLLAWLEDRRQGGRTRRQRALAFVAGIFFAADLTFFHHAIVSPGAPCAGPLLVRRRAQDGRHVAGPILDATVATAIFSALGGLVVGDLGPFPGWQSVGWLVPPALPAPAGGAPPPAPAQPAGRLDLPGHGHRGRDALAAPAPRCRPRGGRRGRGHGALRARGGRHETFDYHVNPMQTHFRDLTCGDARRGHVGRRPSLAGWGHRRRGLGQPRSLPLRA